MTNRLSERSFDLMLKVFLIVISLVTLYPFLYVLFYSLSDSMAVMIKPITFYPVHLTFRNYEVVFQNKMLWGAFFITVARTAAGVVYAVIVTSLAAYAMSKPDLPGGRLFAFFFVIPMYVTGGLLPYYVLITKLHLFNSFWVYIIPQGFWTFNMLLIRTYYHTIPDSLEESAKIDGAGNLTIFFKIMFPLSMPVVAAVVMFVGVWQWNSWFDASLFITKQNLLPLQSILQRLLLDSSGDLQAQAQLALGVKQTTAESLKMASISMSVIPIVLLYPFMQKYFVKGMTIGAVKA